MKIKINWGTGIVIAILSFMTFIIFLVVSMTTNQEFNHDLVVEEYYKQELSFQDQLNRETNSQNLRRNIQVEHTENGLTVLFPTNMEVSEITGEILVYRPSNKEMDFNIPVALSSHQLLIPAENLEKGRWNIEIDWAYENESYYFKKEITY